MFLLCYPAATFHGLLSIPLQADTRLDFHTMLLLCKPFYSVQYKESEEHDINPCYLVFISNCIGEHYKAYLMGHTTCTDLVLKSHPLGAKCIILSTPHHSLQWALTCIHVTISGLSLALLKISNRYLAQ